MSINRFYNLDSSSDTESEEGAITDPSFEPAEESGSKAGTESGSAAESDSDAGSSASASASASAPKTSAYSVVMRLSPENSIASVNGRQEQRPSIFIKVLDFTTTSPRLPSLESIAQQTGCKDCLPTGTTQAPGPVYYTVGEEVALLKSKQPGDSQQVYWKMSPKTDRSNFELVAFREILQRTFQFTVESIFGPSAFKFFTLPPIYKTAEEEGALLVHCTAADAELWTWPGRRFVIAALEYVPAMARATIFIDLFDSKSHTKGGTFSPIALLFDASKWNSSSLQEDLVQLPVLVEKTWVRNIWPYLEKVSIFDSETTYVALPTPKKIDTLKFQLGLTMNIKDHIIALPQLLANIRQRLARLDGVQLDNSADVFTQTTVTVTCADEREASALIAANASFYLQVRVESDTEAVAAAAAGESTSSSGPPAGQGHFISRCAWCDLPLGQKKKRHHASMDLYAYCGKTCERADEAAV